MIYLNLFFTFFQIGAVSFGGGYAMIPLMQEKCLSNGWLSIEEIMNFIAISESTPGPFAINMATFIGSSQGGILGSLIATLSICLPSFIIILIVASLLQNLMKYKIVQSILSSIRPVVIGLILSAGVTMFLKVLFDVTTVNSTPSVDFRGVGIFLFITLSSFVYKKVKKSPPSPILLIICSAVLGIILY